MLSGEAEGTHFQRDGYRCSGVSPYQERFRRLIAGLMDASPSML